MENHVFSEGSMKIGVVGCRHRRIFVILWVIKINVRIKKQVIMKVFGYVFWAFALLGASFLGSCTDDEGNGQQDETLAGPVTADVTYYVGDMGDFDKYLDITVAYLDADSVMQSAGVVTVPWSKEVKGMKVPSNPTMVISYKLKEGVVFDQPDYRIGSDLQITAKLSDGRLEDHHSSDYTTTQGSTAEIVFGGMEENPDIFKLELTEGGQEDENLYAKR